MEDLQAKRTEIEAEGKHPEEVAREISALFPASTPEAFVSPVATEEEETQP